MAGKKYCKCSCPKPEHFRQYEVYIRGKWKTISGKACNLCGCRKYREHSKKSTTLICRTCELVKSRHLHHKYLVEAPCGPGYYCPNPYGTLWNPKPVSKTSCK